MTQTNHKGPSAASGFARAPHPPLAKGERGGIDASALQSLPPPFLKGGGLQSLAAPSFVEQFLRLNGFDAEEFVGWELLPGMKFGEREAWWRDGAPRDAPHEGLDLCGFRTREGSSVPLGPGARIPALWAGAIVAAVPDFLGRSVFVVHDRQDGEGRRLHSVYGHLAPLPGLAPGSHLREGDAVGAIADPATRSSSVPAHLHLTVAWIAASPSATLSWSVLREPARTMLIDPLPLLGR